MGGSFLTCLDILRRSDSVFLSGTGLVSCFDDGVVVAEAAVDDELFITRGGVDEDDVLDDCFEDDVDVVVFDAKNGALRRRCCSVSS